MYTTSSRNPAGVVVSRSTRNGYGSLHGGKPGDENRTSSWESMSNCYWTDRMYIDFMGYKMRTHDASITVWSVFEAWACARCTCVHSNAALHCCSACADARAACNVLMYPGAPAGRTGAEAEMERETVGVHQPRRLRCAKGASHRGCQRGI